MAGTNDGPAKAERIQTLLKRLADFRARWSTILHPYDAGDALSESRAVQAVQEGSWRLFRDEFVSLAAEAVDTLGREQFPLGLENPRLYEHPPGIEDLPFKLTGSTDTAEAGQRILLHAARQHDLDRWGRDVNYPSMLADWVMNGLVCAAQQGEPHRRVIIRWIRWVELAIQRMAGLATTDARRTRVKRSTAKGDAEAKIVAALPTHHKFADGSPLNYEPIGVNALARLAKVSPDSVNRFFNKEFGSQEDAKDGFANYQAACRDGTKLTAVLKKLTGAYSLGPSLFGRTPPNEGWADRE
jgi:hypothetical protein